MFEQRDPSTLKEQSEGVVRLSNGASMDVAREMLVRWCEKHSEERRPHQIKQLIPLAARDGTTSTAFYILPVRRKKVSQDREGLGRSFPRPNRSSPRPPPLVAALIDGDFEECQYVSCGPRAAPSERGQFPFVSGRICGFVGREYVNTHGLAYRYYKLHSLRLDDPMDCKRQPKIPPLGFEVLADDEVQRA